MSRYGSVAYSMGPGPLSQAIKTLMAVNVGAYLLSLIVPAIIVRLGLLPAMVVEQLAFWQPFTYMFLHGGLGHLAVQHARAVDVRHRARTHLGHALLRALLHGHRHRRGAGHRAWSLSPLPYAAEMYRRWWWAPRGPSTACCSPTACTSRAAPSISTCCSRSRRATSSMLVGAIAFLSSIGSSGGGVAHVAHLGGLLVGYLYLKGRRGPLDEIKYRWLQWRLGRVHARSSTSIRAAGARRAAAARTGRRSGRSTCTRGRVSGPGARG